MKTIDKAEVCQRLERDGKLKVIRYVMQETGASLSDAKQFVESLIEPDNIQAQVEIPIQNPIQPDEGKVHSFLVQGEKLQAIQFVMKETGMDLNEAKNYVEAIACKIDSEKHQAAIDDMSPVRERRGGKGLFIAAICIVLFLGILLLMNLDKLF